MKRVRIGGLELGEIGQWHMPDCTGMRTKTKALAQLDNRLSESHHVEPQFTTRPPTKWVRRLWEGISKHNMI